MLNVNHHRKYYIFTFYYYWGNLRRKGRGRSCIQWVKPYELTTRFGWESVRLIPRDLGHCLRWWSRQGPGIKGIEPDHERSILSPTQNKLIILALPQQFCKQNTFIMMQNVCFCLKGECFSNLSAIFVVLITWHKPEMRKDSWSAICSWLFLAESSIHFMFIYSQTDQNSWFFPLPFSSLRDKQTNQHKKMFFWDHCPAKMAEIDMVISFCLSTETWCYGNKVVGYML